MNTCWLCTKGGISFGGLFKTGNRCWKIYFAITHKPTLLLCVNLGSSGTNENENYVSQHVVGLIIYYMISNLKKQTIKKTTTKTNNITHLCIGANVDVNVLRSIIHYANTLIFTIIQTSQY